MSRRLAASMQGAGGLLALVLVLAFASGAGGAAAPAAGATATYRWTSSLTQELAVLVRETSPDGRESWSIAHRVAAPPPLLVTYEVVRRDARTYTLQIVTRERADGTPLSVTQVTVDGRSGRAVRSVIRGHAGITPTRESGLRPLGESDVADGRREAVSVPAGTIDALRGRAGDAEVWVSEQVAPLGLVKAVWPNGTLELVENATQGAQDLLRAR